LSNTFPIQNGLKQGNALSQLLLMFTFECVFRKIQEMHEGLKLNGKHQLMTYVDDNKEHCVLHIQSNTTIFYLLVQYEYNYMFRPYMWAFSRL
jgi:hypothetical protein